MTQPIIPCLNCKHLILDGKRRCAAFDSIPDVIQIGENDHRQPFPGDNGIQFEPIKELVRA